MASLTISAGPDARARLQEEGLNESQFRVLVGASGGPKWFVLYGLDRYLGGEFFATRKQPLLTLGSSAGAWRMCCLACQDPVAAIDRLAQLYSREQYSLQPDVGEITHKARVMLDRVLGPEGRAEIVNNVVYKTHIIADRCKGIGSSERRLLQALSLGSAALANAASRRLLSLFFQRTVFSSIGSQSPWAQLQDLDTQIVELTQSNVFKAMLASGSIPFVLEGERDIDGAKPGLYLDGGITDYHFDLPFHQGAELVLYPHFSNRIKPGWFDKHLPWRKPQQSNYRNVVLLSPSAEFVSKLPFGKIPDRGDFNRMDYESRVKYWQQVLDQSQYLAEDFAHMVQRGAGLDNIQALLVAP